MCKLQIASFENDLIKTLKSISLALIFCLALPSHAGNGGYSPPPPAVLPPSEGGLVPSNLQVNVPPNTMVQIGFTKSINEIINGINFYMVDDNLARVRVEVFDYEDYGILRPLDLLEPNTTYTVNFDSSNDNNLDREWQFTTGETLDEGEASVVSTTPADGGTEVSPTAPVKFKFDRNMSPMSFTESNVIAYRAGLTDDEEDWVPVGGTLSYDFQEKSAVFQPFTSYPNGFAYGSSVLIQLFPAEIEDFYGNPFNEMVEFTYETKSTGSKTYTSTYGSSTFTVPLGVTQISIRAEGGEGGEGTGCGYYSGDDGDYGNVVRRTYQVEPGQTFTISVGEGGEGGEEGYSNSEEDGEDGETTSVTTIYHPNIYAYGGDGGDYEYCPDDPDDPDYVPDVTDGDDGSDGEVIISW